MTFTYKQDFVLVNNICVQLSVGTKHVWVQFRDFKCSTVSNSVLREKFMVGNFLKMIFFFNQLTKQSLKIGFLKADFLEVQYLVNQNFDLSRTV